MQSVEQATNMLPSTEEVSDMLPSTEEVSNMLPSAEDVSNNVAAFVFGPSEGKDRNEEILGEESDEESPETSLLSTEAAVEAPEASLLSTEAAVEAPEASLFSTEAAVEAPEASLLSTEAAVESERMTEAAVEAPKASLLAREAAVEAPEAPAGPEEQSSVLSSLLTGQFFGGQRSEEQEDAACFDARSRGTGTEAAYTGGATVEHRVFHRMGTTNSVLTEGTTDSVYGRARSQASGAEDDSLYGDRVWKQAAIAFAPAKIASEEDGEPVRECKEFVFGDNDCKKVVYATPDAEKSSSVSLIDDDALEAGTSAAVWISDSVFDRANDAADRVQRDTYRDRYLESAHKYAAAVTKAQAVAQFAAVSLVGVVCLGLGAYHLLQSQQE